MNAQDQFLDAQIRRAVFMEGLQAGFIRKMHKILRESDANLKELLQKRLENISRRGGDTGPTTTARLEHMIAATKELRAGTAAALVTQNSQNMRELVADEIRYQTQSFDRHIPVALVLAEPAVAATYAAATARPIQGQMMKDWFRAMARNDVRRIEAAIRVGYVEGAPTPDIVRNIVGTRANRFSDGVANVIRRDASTIVRTATNHYANVARDTLWAENKDILHGLRWVSTLDGRTSPICQARDGEVYPVDEGPRPPAHPNCRSVMVPHFDDVKLAGMGRPYVTDTRTRRRREVDFRAEAKERAGDSWKGMSERDRRGLIGGERRRWSAENIGRTSADVNYQDFLRRQPAKFQDEVLGSTKGKLFRRGDVELDRFVNDRTGRAYSLTEIQRREPEAWARVFSKSE